MEKLSPISVPYLHPTSPYHSQIWVIYGPCFAISFPYFFFGKGTPPKRRNGIEKRRNRETQQHSDITKQRVENFAHNFTSKPKAPFSIEESSVFISSSVYRETIDVELLTALRLILIIYRVNDKISRETRTFQYSVPFQQYLQV